MLDDNNDILLLEASNGKRYKCPYCELRAEREDLITHVEEEHEDLIPQGYTAVRVVFNAINKKEHGNCIQCGSETEWDDNTCKYKRLCPKKKCYDAYVKLVRERMTNSYGVPSLMNDMEHQKKMLSNRKISGEYKFKDGGIRSFCGSYEKKLLEFYDKTLGVHSNEIMSPGPTIEYMFNGEKLYWITDQYYITANLVHDAKDGGDNPNNREMPEYRAKQVAKEEAIAKMNKYNYIRLTNNNFQQLLLSLSEIKKNLLDNDSSHTIHINETSLAASTGGVMPNISDGYVTKFTNGDMIQNDGIAFSKDLNDVYVIKDNKVIKKKPNQLGECTIFKVVKECSEIKEYVESLYESQEDVEYDSNYFYKLISEKQVLSPDQICFDEGCIEEPNMYYEALIKREIDRASILEGLFNNDTLLPIIEASDIILKDNKISKYNNVNIIQNIDGYFAININNHKRTGIYESVNQIPDILISMLNKI